MDGVTESNPQATPSFPGNLLTGRELFACALRLYEERFWLLIKIYLLPYLIAFLCGLVIFGGAIGAALLSSKVGLIFAIILGIILGLAFFYISIWAGVAVIFAVKDDIAPTARGAFREAKKDINSYAWLAFLLITVWWGASVLFVIPGVYLFVAFTSAIYVLVVEDVRGINALIKSAEYVRGRWWRVCWRLIFLQLVVFGGSMLINFAFGFVVGIISPSKILTTILVQIVQFVVGLVLGLFSSVYGFELYKTLRETKGEFVFVPRSGQRLGYGLLAFLGVIIIPLVIFAAVYFATHLAPRVDSGNAVPKTGSLSSGFDPLGLDKTRVAVRDARRVQDIQLIRNELELYNDKMGEYPNSMGGRWGTARLLEEMAKQNASVVSLPSDPLGGDYYFYGAKDDYVLQATLEEDPASSVIYQGSQKSITAQIDCDPINHHFCLSSIY